MSRVICLLLVLAVITPCSAQLDQSGLFVVLGFTDQRLAYLSLEEENRTDLGALGNVANALRLFDGELWVVHSGDFNDGSGAEIWHASITEEIAVAVEEERDIEWQVIMLDDWSNPYDVLVTGDYAYITLTGQNALVKLDISDGTETARLDDLNSPEGLAVSGTLLAVANSGWGNGNTVTLTDAETLVIAATVEVSDNPQWMAVDSDERFHIVCSGRSWGDDPVSGAIAVYDPSDQSLETLPLENNPVDVVILPSVELGEKVVVGDEYAYNCPHISAYFVETLEMDDVVPEGLAGGWSLAASSEGDLFIGSTTDNTIQRFSYNWESRPIETEFNSGIADLLYYDPAGENLAQNSPVIPHDFQFLPAYPNPFNSATRLAFVLAGDSRVELNIYSSDGRLAGTLLDSDVSAGRHSISFEAAGLGSGVYFAVLRTGGFSQTRRLALVK